MKSIIYFLLISIILLSTGCKELTKDEKQISVDKHLVIFDTDANNELDDQHALAYLLLNGDTFTVKGITVNATYNGGNIHDHVEEADRVLKLCGLDGQIPLLAGANASFPEIMPHLNEPDYDGHEAVDFIIETANNSASELIILAVGKLTNPALALEKDPSLSSKIRIVWLGSNYPDPGEYNQVNDTASMNYLLKSNVPFEMVTVRYGKPSGTDAVKVTQEEAFEQMPGRGPKITVPVTGRHGGEFYNFGDYSKSLFEHIDYHGDPPSRSLFDMAAVAIVKNPQWADYSEIPAPILVKDNWKDQPENKRMMGLWENFNKKEIMDDFYSTFENYILASKD